MFNHNFKGIIIVHNDTVFWIAGNGSSPARCLLKIPLNQFLEDETLIEKVPKWSKANHKILCIVPDHWFGMESYPFQPKKPSLIEPFLERKLKTAYPELKQVHQFFNYRNVAGSDGKELLFAHFLQDEQGYQLYNVLSGINFTPARITAPAFLWEQSLNRSTQHFTNSGALLIHICDQECALYFYSNGAYLFSRTILLQDAMEGLESLSFEINQSLHMFSQTTKSELDQVFLLSDQPISREVLAEKLELGVVDLRSRLSNQDQLLKIRELPLLSGPLHRNELNDRASFFSVFHRRIRKVLFWKPVQFAGILAGLLMLLPLTGETYLLNQTLKNEQSRYQGLRKQMSIPGASSLTEHGQTLNRVLAAAEKPAYAVNAFRLLDSLPLAVGLIQLDISLENRPVMEVTAVAKAEDADQLNQTLSQLIGQLSLKFKTAQTPSIDDIDIRPEPSAIAQAVPRYRLSFQLGLL